MLSAAECHKEILSQVGKCVCRGIILLNTFAKAMSRAYLSQHTVIKFCFLQRQCVVIGLAEYHKEFTSPAGKYLQRKYVKLILTDY